MYALVVFFFQAEDGIRDATVTGVQTCALPISLVSHHRAAEPCARFCACLAWANSFHSRAHRRRNQVLADDRCLQASGLATGGTAARDRIPQRHTGAQSGPILPGGKSSPRGRPPGLWRSPALTVA